MTRYVVQNSTSAAAAPDRLGLIRRTLALLAVVAFFLQSLAVQTHIHPAKLTLPGSVAAGSVPALPGPLNSPDLDQGCRLCQEIAHAGAYIAPAVAMPALMLAWAASTLFPALASERRPAPGFAWRSRGPPGT